jgi:heme/copper-type cytochrome/quinol oxidase subunit 1
MALAFILQVVGCLAANPYFMIDSNFGFGWEFYPDPFHPTSMIFTFNVRYK